MPHLLPETAPPKQKDSRQSRCNDWKAKKQKLIKVMSYNCESLTDKARLQQILDFGNSIDADIITGQRGGPSTGG